MIAQISAKLSGLSGIGSDRAQDDGVHGNAVEASAAFRCRLQRQDEVAASGRPGIARCWSSFRMRTRSTGHGPPSIAPACPPKRGLRDGSEPGGSGRAAHEAPSRRGRQRHAARPEADRCRQSRQPPAGRHARCGAGRAYGPTRSPTAQTGQAARRQGLRPAPLSARWRGWPASAVFQTATSGAPTSTSPSRRSPAPSSAELRQNGSVPNPKLQLGYATPKS